MNELRQNASAGRTEAAFNAFVACISESHIRSQVAIVRDELADAVQAAAMVLGERNARELMTLHWTEFSEIDDALKAFLHT